MSKYLKAVELAAMYGCGVNSPYMKGMKKKCGTRRVNCTIKKIMMAREQFKLKGALV